jgi:hypothetical protein
MSDIQAHMTGSTSGSARMQEAEKERGQRCERRKRVGLEKAEARGTMHRRDKGSRRLMPEIPSTCTAASRATWRRGGSSPSDIPPALRGIRRGQQGQLVRPSRMQPRLYAGSGLRQGRGQVTPSNIQTWALGSLCACRSANERDLDLGCGAGAEVGSRGTRLGGLLDSGSASDRRRVSTCFGLDGDCAPPPWGGLPMQGAPVV